MSQLQPPEADLTDGVVTLRRFTDADATAITDACQDEAIQRFLPLPEPYELHHARAYLARTRRQWEEGSKAAFAVADAAEPDHLLGAVNLAVDGGVGNAAYWVAPWARSRGVATRALRLLTAWAEGPVGLGVVILEIRPENTPSRHVAEAAGFHQSGEIDVNLVTGKEHGLIYSRLVSDRI